jgi:hypothetical protein
MQLLKMNTAALAFLLTITALCTGCGDGGNTASTGSSLPQRNDPAFGTVGNVLISDRFDDIDGVHDEVWIGFNTQQAWDQLVALNQDVSPLSPGWIGGHLIADPRHHLGFYFDPNTTDSGEVTSETQQTSIDGLKRTPQFSADNQPQEWEIPAVVEKIVPTAN